jgi:heat shock protein HslJ
LTSLTIANPPFQGNVPAAEQPKFTMAFAADGSFSALADCNTLIGTWSAGSGGALTLQIGPSSLVACGDDSLSDLYIIGLNNVVSYAIASKQLTLTTDDGGTLVYKAAP